MRLYEHLDDQRRAAAWAALTRRIEASLREDLGDEGDVTTNAIFPESARGRAHVIAKQSGIVCGGEVFSAVFTILGSACAQQLVPDGQQLTPGTEVFRIDGSVRTLLAGERTALNFLQRLSGIATATHDFVGATAGRIAICDTRKTTPGWRDLEKYAVRCGGGTNHRFGLFDMVMIKDTHADGAGGLAEAIRRVSHLRPRLRVAAEARNLEEVRAAIDSTAVDLLMLDNMDDSTIATACQLVDGRIEIEVTGGITPERTARLAALRVDRVSVGALTHSVRAMDYSMRLVDVAPTAS